MPGVGSHATRSALPCCGGWKPGTAGAGLVFETSAGGKRLPSDEEMDAHLISSDVC